MGFKIANSYQELTRKQKSFFREMNNLIVRQNMTEEEKNKQKTEDIVKRYR
jgi:hypothetical protein